MHHDASRASPHTPRRVHASPSRVLISGFWLLTSFTLLACQVQRPDVAAEVGRASGLQNAIVFRVDGEAAATEPTNGMLLPADAVRLALLHDPRVQISLAHVRMAEADANQARLLPNPILTVDLRFPTQAGSNTAFETTLTGDLIALLQKPGQIAAADKRLRAAARDALTTVLDLISEVHTAYSAARGTDTQIENLQSRSKILRQLREIARKRLAAGEGIRLDVLTLDCAVAQLELDLSDLQAQRDDQRLLLARLIGQPRSEATWQLEAWQSAGPETLAVESAWIDAALANRPEIESKLWELRALGDDYNAAAFAPLAGNSIGPHAEHDPEWRVGPTLATPLPIFDFGQAGREKIRAQQIAARHELAQQQFEVIQDIRSAYTAYRHAQESLVAVRDRLLPLQQQQLDQARLAYQSGEADLATLLLAETDLQMTLSKIIDLQEKTTVARVKLQRAAGGAAVAQRLEGPATAPPATTEPAGRPPAATLPTTQPRRGPRP